MAARDLAKAIEPAKPSLRSDRLGTTFPVRVHDTASGYLVDATGEVIGNVGGEMHTEAQERALAKYVAAAMNAAAGSQPD